MTVRNLLLRAIITFFVLPGSAKEIEVTTQDVLSGRTNGAFTIITSGIDFPNITLECRSEDGSRAERTLPNYKGPVPTEFDIEDLQPGKYIDFGVCDFNADGDAWRNLPTCWKVEQVSVCENSKGIFCGSIDSFAGVGVRLISIPEGDSVTISTGGTGKVISDFDGYCHTAIGEGAELVTTTSNELDVVYPRYETTPWAITFKDEGDALPGCQTCLEGCVTSTDSEFDICLDTLEDVQITGHPSNSTMNLTMGSSNVNGPSEDLVSDADDATNEGSTGPEDAPSSSAFRNHPLPWWT